MLTVGLTGPMGAGKTTVARLLEQHGAKVISADRLGHHLLEPGQSVYTEVVKRYGERVLRPDGTIDRRALGKIVFSTSEELALYNAVVHPPLVAALLDELEAWRGQGGRSGGVLVFDAALLYEWSIEHAFDVIVLVSAEPATRAKRIQERDNLDNERFLQRDRVQVGPRPGRRPPDVIISNDGDFDALQRQVSQLWDRLQRDFA